MGLYEDSEISLQVLRGLETDITNELNEIKVCMLTCIVAYCSLSWLFVHESILISFTVCYVQRSVASSSKRTAIRFSELKRKRYWYPLMVL